MQHSAQAALDQGTVDLGSVQRIAAFSDGAEGGNPAGVWIGAELPPEAEMQRIAHAVGFSETAFAAPLQSSSLASAPSDQAAPLDAAAGQGAGQSAYRVRYFSPEAEVPFCGHATIALGAALAAAHGDGVYALTLNDARITVEGRREERAGMPLVAAALQSPPTRSRPAPPEAIHRALALFGYRAEDLDPRIPPALAHGGADHLVLALRSRALLQAMRYDLDAGRAFMRELGIVTVVLAWAESDSLFHTRNPFAAGGVYEDPATGAGTAALAGYLRDIGWMRGGQIDVVQGEDMGMRSRLRAHFDATPGSSIRVSGTARSM